MKTLFSQAAPTGAILAVLLTSTPAPRANAAPPVGLPDTSKMNVLFIIREDCYAGVWGAYGNTICRKVCRRFVEFVDFIPTLGDLSGIAVAPDLEGTSFAPLLANPEQPWKSAVFQVFSETDQMVRNERYRYLAFKGGAVPEALYDLERDPWKTVNLARDPAHARVRSEMAALLAAGWKAARPGAAR